MSVAEIKRLNGLNGNSLSEGRTILVAQNNTATKQDMINFIDTDNTPDTYRSNMPTMAPIQTAKLKTDTVKTVVIPANTIAQEQAPASFDFVANTKSCNYPYYRRYRYNRPTPCRTRSNRTIHGSKNCCGHNCHCGSRACTTCLHLNRAAGRGIRKISCPFHSFDSRRT